MPSMITWPPTISYLPSFKLIDSLANIFVDQCHYSYNLFALWFNKIVRRIYK